MSTLDFCAKDADDICEMLHTFCNVSSLNSRIITSTKSRPQSSPWESFTETVLQLQHEFVRFEDDLIFFFSGHGVQGVNTTVVFKNTEKSILDISKVIDELSPKTKIMLFDSCYSGSGLEEHERSATLFTQVARQSRGTFIIAACASNQTAKEAKFIQNGKFTRTLIDIVTDKQNYDNEAYLDINSIYSKLNILFFEDPKNEQKPFIQVKLTAGYPFANGFNEEEFLVRFTGNNPNDFDWHKVLKALNSYLSIEEEMMGELLSLIREQVSNTLDDRKGEATFQAIEIAKNRVLLSDDGNFFDLLSPPAGVVGRGGISTATSFKNDFEGQYVYNCSASPGHNEYFFNFPVSTSTCSLFIDFQQLTYLDTVVIPEECAFYTIRFKKHILILSMSYTFVEKFTQVAKLHGKKIVFEIPYGSKLLEHFNRALHQYDAHEWIEVAVYDKPISSTD